MNFTNLLLLNNTVTEDKAVGIYIYESENISFTNLTLKENTKESVINPYAVIKIYFFLLKIYKKNVIILFIL